MVSPASSGASASNSASSADALAVMSEIDSDANSLAAIYPNVPLPILKQVAAANSPGGQEMFAYSMMDLSATAHDSTLVYTFKFLNDDATADQAKRITESNVYPNMIQSLKEDGVANPVIQCYFYDKNGKLLYSQEYK